MAARRHQPVLRAFQIAGLSLLLLDLLLYAAVFRPTQALLSSEQRQFEALRRRSFQAERRIERLSNFLAALPSADERLSSFEEDHTPPRRQAYSEAAKLVRQVADASGAQLEAVAFKLEPKPSGPLQRLGIVMRATGSFPALLKLAHGLETASQLMVTRGFALAQAEHGGLELRLDTDLYLTP